MEPFKLETGKYYRMRASKAAPTNGWDAPEVKELFHDYTTSDRRSWDDPRVLPRDWPAEQSEGPAVFVQFRWIADTQVVSNDPPNLEWWEYYPTPIEKKQSGWGLSTPVQVYAGGAVVGGVVGAAAGGVATWAGGSRHPWRGTAAGAGMGAVAGLGLTFGLRWLAERSV